MPDHVLVVDLMLRVFTLDGANGIDSVLGVFFR